MVGSAEPSEELRRGRRALEDLAGEVTIVADWQPAADKTERWQLVLELRPTGLSTVHSLPAASRWVVIVDSAYPRGRIEVFPAKEGGLLDTFPHQLANDAGDEDLPWRSGLICLIDAISGHTTAMARDDPTEPAARLVWWVWRALEWLRAASRGELLRPGEPFELPVFGQRSLTRPMVAFSEGEETLPAWNHAPRCGLVDLAPVGDGRYALAARVFRTLALSEVTRPAWGDLLASVRGSQKGVWVRFDALPVLQPWQAPRTWGELISIAEGEGWDLMAELRMATAGLRDGRYHLVLIGFPVPRSMGEIPIAQHWASLRLPPLNNAKAKTPVPGFRTPNARWVADRQTGPLADDAPLDWVPTANWHPSELGSRGRYDGGLRGTRVVLLGAGALGSALAHLLVRAGDLHLSIVDPGSLEAGNLVRHVLTIDSLGQSKAVALSGYLSHATPNGRTVGLWDAFPPTNSDTHDAVRQAPLIIDASADEGVLATMGTYAWGSDKTFVSVSLSYGAERLYLYVAAGIVFPVADFEDAVRPWIESDAKLPEELPWEGIGCWHSVFPARADDVSLMAAVASRVIDERLRTPIRQPELYVFERQPDGGVIRVDRP